MCSSESPDGSSDSGSSAPAAKPRYGQLDRRIAPDGLIPEEEEGGGKHVTLKLECETASEARLLVGSLQAVIALGALLLCAEIILKYKANTNHYFSRRRIAIFNVALAGACFLAMTCALLSCLRHIWLARHQVWTQRRVRLLSAYAAMLVIQMINVIFWIVPSAALLHSQCYWYSHLVDTCGLIRWTSWNTLFAILSIMTHCCCPQRTQSGLRRLWQWLRRRPPSKQRKDSSGEEDTGLGDARHINPVIEQGGTSLDTFAGGRDDRIILDSPFWAHWPSAIVWLVLEADLIWQRATSGHNKPVGNCDNFVRECYSKNAQARKGQTATRLLAVFFLGYSVLFIYYSTKTFRALRRSPYQLFRVGGMIARIQRNTARSVVWFLFLATGTLWFSGDTFCSSYLMAWFGLAPNQLVMSGLVVVLSILFMPRSANDLEPLRKVLLQQIAWDEGSRMRKRAVRKSVTARHAGLGTLEHDPLFCLETALKAFHFSFLSYRYEEHAGADIEAAGDATDDPDALEGVVPLDTRMGPALQLFGLSSLEIMREATHDTKLLIGSGPGVIVLAFRGTSSVAAAKADLQVMLAKHPRQPREASRRWPAMVHKGFQLAWTSGGFRRRVLERVRQLLGQCSKGSPPRILLCGHSLGGALASLAAYDIQCEFDLPLGQSICKYSPRLGNSTFAADYNRRLPETWHIINDRDPITQVGKFKVYKRVGHQAIVYATGDICVRPGPLERRLHFAGEYFAVEMLLVHVLCSLWRAGKRLQHHFLSEYGFSLMMVLAAQFTSKGIAGGAQGVADMLSRERGDTVRTILESGGFVLAEVMHNSGYALEADGQVVKLAAPSASTEDALANVYKLGARKWRRDRKGRPSEGVSFGNADSAGGQQQQQQQGGVTRTLTAPFVAVTRKFRGGE